MVEVIHKGLAIKTECEFYGAELKFDWKDMKHMTDKDSEWQLTPQARKIRYIECPVCHEKIFVRNDDSGWMNGTKRIEEDHKNGVQQ